MIYGSDFFQHKKTISDHCTRRVSAIKGIDGPPAQWVRSSSLYRELIRDQFENSELWAALGQVYERQGKSTKASDSYRRSFQLEPTNYKLAFCWARTALEAGVYSDVKDAFRQMQSLDPQRATGVEAFIQGHPTWQKGKAAEAADARRRGKHASGFFGDKENENTVPHQDPKDCAAPRQV